MFNTYIDRSDKSVIHKYPDTIKEIKAPTDDSIRLYGEFKEKAIKEIIATIRPEDNAFKASGIVYYKDFPTDKTSFILRFSINGKEYEIRDEFTREDSYKAYNKYKGLGNEVMYKLILEKFSQLMAIEFMKQELKTIENIQL